MNNGSNQYREFAEECVQLAQEINIERYRKILKEMAEVWNRLAKEEEAKA